MAPPSSFLTLSFLALTVFAVPIGVEATPDRTGNALPPAGVTIGQRGYQAGWQIKPSQSGPSIVNHRTYDDQERASQREIAQVAQQSASAGASVASDMSHALQPARAGGIPQRGSGAHHDYAAAATVQGEPLVGQPDIKRDLNAQNNDTGHPWAIGERLPRSAYDRSRWIGGDRTYGLPVPSPHLTWVRVPSDAFLVDQRSGEIIQVRHGLLR